MKLPYYIFLTYATISNAWIFGDLRDGLISYWKRLHDYDTRTDSLESLKRLRQIQNIAKLRAAGKPVAYDDSLESNRPEPVKSSDLDDVLSKVLKETLDDMSNDASEDVSYEERLLYGRRNLKDKYRRSHVSVSSSSTGEIKDNLNTWIFKNQEVYNITPIDMGGEGKCRDAVEGTEGFCTTGVQCEPGHRLLRGDMNCRRDLVCCYIIQINSTDDISYPSFDSYSGGVIPKMSSENSDTQKHGSKKLVRRLLNMIKIVTQMMKLDYQNGVKIPTARYNHLSRFLKDLKEEYKNITQTIKERDERNDIVLSGPLLLELKKLSETNQKFINNAVFRQIMINGTMSKKTARMLVDAEPNLEFLVENDLQRHHQRGYIREHRRKNRKNRRRSQTRSTNGYRNHKFDEEFGYLYY